MIFHPTANLQRRLSPIQTRKTREIPVVGNPRATVFNGERREPGVCHPRSPCPRLGADSLEYRPVPLTRRDDLRVASAKKPVAKREGFVERGRLRADPRVGRNSNKGAECERRNAVAASIKHHTFEPRLTDAVLGRIWPERVDQDIDVGEDQEERRSDAISSNSSRRFKSSQLSPGVRPPLAELTGSGVRSSGGEGERSLTTRRRPSSMRDVSERPSEAALCLARMTRSAGRRTVVLFFIYLFWKATQFKAKNAP